MSWFGGKPGSETVSLLGPGDRPGDFAAQRHPDSPLSGTGRQPAAKIDIPCREAARRVTSPADPTPRDAFAGQADGLVESGFGRAGGCGGRRTGASVWPWAGRPRCRSAGSGPIQRWSLRRKVVGTLRVPSAPAESLAASVTTVGPPAAQRIAGEGEGCGEEKNVTTRRRSHPTETSSATAWRVPLRPGPLAPGPRSE